MRGREGIGIDLTSGGDEGRDGHLLPPLRRDTRLHGWALGHGVSAVGDHIFNVALVYTAAQVASPAMAGAIVAVAVAPRAVLSVFAGAAVDRLDARRVMLTSDIGQMVVLAVATAVLALAGPSVALLVVLSLAYGTASAFYGPAAFTFPRQLRRREELGRVASIRQLTGRLAGIGGPPLGGLLVATIGLSGALLVDASSFAVIAIVLLLVQPRWALARERGGSLLSDVRSGLAYVRSTPHVRDLVLSLAGLNVFLAPVTTVGVALRTTEEGWGPLAMGVLMGAIGAAAAVGTLMAMVWQPSRAVFTALLLLVAQAGAMSVVGFAPYPAVMAAMIAIGLTAGLASPLLSGAFQATVDEEFMGRASALTSLADDALIPLSLAGFGVLASVTDLTIACILFGVGFCGLLLYSASRPHIRSLQVSGADRE